MLTIIAPTAIAGSRRFEKSGSAGVSPLVNGIEPFSRLAISSKFIVSVLVSSKGCGDMILLSAVI